MAVGRDEAHRVGMQDEQRAVEEIPRVFPGDRKLRFRDHLAHDVTRQRRGIRPRRFRQRRKILARQRLHARVEPIRRDLHASLVFLDPHVGFGKRLDDLVQLLCRKGQRAAFRHGGGAFAPQPDLEVCGKQFHLVALRLHEDIRENRDGVLPLHDPLKELQFAQQIGLADDQFHGDVVLGGSDYRNKEL